MTVQTNYQNETDEKKNEAIIANGIAIESNEPNYVVAQQTKQETKKKFGELNDTFWKNYVHYDSRQVQRIACARLYKDYGGYLSKYDIEQAVKSKYINTHLNKTGHLLYLNTRRVQYDADNAQRELQRKIDTLKDQVQFVVLDKYTKQTVVVSNQCCMMMN